MNIDERVQSKVLEQIQADMEALSTRPSTNWYRAYLEPDGDDAVDGNGVVVELQQAKREEGGEND